ncbi:MAG: hypothetical protein JF617_02535, partial [Burkholderiales bacterium]|nr:hypothetical protein [Burkholderiales bacterium]
MDPNGLNLTSRTSYDANGHVSTVTDPNGTVTLYTYDQLGRKASQSVDPAGLNLVTTYSYDAQGNLARTIDPKGQQSRFLYDADNRLQYEIDPEYGLTEYRYDAMGQLRQSVRYTERQAGIQTFDAGMGLIKHSLTAITVNTVNSQVTNYKYDVAGRKIGEIDAAGSVTEYVYDAAGQVTKTIQYATSAKNLLAYDKFSSGMTGYTAWSSDPSTLNSGVNLDVNWSVPGQQTLWLRQANNASNASADAAILSTATSQPVQYGKRYYVSALVGVHRASAYLFVWFIDANGNRISSASLTGETSSMGVEEATGGTTLASYKKLSGYVTAVSGAVSIQVEVHKSATVAGANDSYLFVADMAAREVNPDAVSATDWRPPASQADHVTRYVYDAAGRKVYTQDALGGVTQTRYDAAGQAVEQIAYSHRISTATAATVATFDAAVQGDAAYDHKTRVVHDALGRARFTIALANGNTNQGAVTETVYDSLGQVARTIQYADYVAYSAITDATTEAGLRALLPASTGAAPLSAREVIYTYDADGRLVYTAQSQWANSSNKYFSLTERRYDAFGQLSEQVAYANTVVLSDLPSIVGTDQIASRLVQDAANDRHSRYTYDADGRVLTATDGEGYVERYAYDAFGRKTQVTNKNGATTDYQYDAVGHLIQELSAAVDVYSVDTSLAVSASTGQRLATRYAYDAFGNLLSRTEAADTAQQRTTRYSYDALGRQVGTTFEAVGVYDINSDSVGPATALSTQTAYDAFGQAVINRDVNGNYSYKTYDQLGRLVNEIDANHNATHHFYSDLVGQFAGFTRLDAKASFGDGLSVSADAINAAVTAVLGSGTPRSVSTYFDQLGRDSVVYDKYSRADMSGAAYSFDGTLGVGGAWISSIGYAYDAFGSLVRRTELLDRSQNRQAITQYGYDLQGQLIRQVDAEGYVTDHHKNAFGEDDRVTQYATAINPDGSLWVNPATLNAQAGNALGYDRVTVTGYDRRGQQTLQSQLGMQVGRATSGTSVVNAYGHLDTRLTTDGVGNVTATATSFIADDGSYTQAGAGLATTYDKLGRAVKVVDALGRTTTTKYDGLGNAVQTTRHANLNPGGTGDPAASANDQVTRQLFDKLGHVLQRRDALNNDTFFAYDAAGHVGKQWAAFHDVDGGLHTASQRFAYDAAGRQTGTYTLMRVGASDVYSADTAVYNAFGEVTAKLRDGVQYAYYDYDVGGRVWRTNADDGVDKVYLYDLQGNVSSVITSPGLDLKTYAGASAVPTTLAAGVRRTNNKVDRRGKLLEQSNLGVTHLDGSTTGQLVRQTYDAWGNTLSVTTTRGNTTNYRYSSANQVVEEDKASHTYYQDYAAGGAAVTGRPATRTFYDAWGRAVASVDARGNTATNSYLVTGELQTETHADAGVVSHVYDNFGRETQRTSAAANAGQANARVYHYTWDKLGHKLTETVDARLLVHPDGANTSFSSFSYVVATYSLGSYAYDEQGNRISATSGDDAKLKSVVQKYYFDSASRLIKSTDPLKATTYEYDAAGHKTAETDALGQRSSWSYKANGQLDTHTDIGGATTSYEYDRAGELTRQSNGRGQDLRTTYYDDGRVKTTQDVWGDSLSTYDYDADGNKTIDRFVTGASTGSPTSYRNVSMSYDALGRMSTVSEPGYQLSFQYDANGNRYRVQGTYVDNDSSPRKVGIDVDFYDPDGLAQRKVDLTYTYDAANRVTGTRTLDYTGPSNALTEAYRWEYFGYDKDGNRTSDEQRFFNAGTAGAVTGRLVEYSYDLASRVAEVFVTTKTSNGSGGDVIGTRRDHRKNLYNTASGFTQEWQWANGYAADSFGYADASPDRVLTTETWTNASGNTTQVVSRQLLFSANTWYLRTNQTSAYDVAGNLKSMHVDGYQDQSTSLASNLDYKYTYLKMDGDLQRSATVTGTQWNGASMASVGSVTTTLDYDVNGRLIGTFDNNAANNSGEQYLVNDHAGHIVLKLRYRAAAALGAHIATGTYDPNTGAQGSAGGSGVPTRVAAPSMTATSTSSVSVERLRYANNQAIGATSQNYSMVFMKTQDVSGYFDRYSVSNSFEDAFGAAQVNVSASSGTQYTWSSGDTLRAVAQTFYGDANLWYVIAEANGYTDEALPVAGDVVRIPSVARSSNTASTFAVYDPSKIVGSTSPEPIAPAPPPPPPSAGGCGMLGTIIVIVVAVVVTYFTAGAATGALLSTLGETGAAVVGGAIGGAVGSVASQGVGIAIGQQQSFSWKQVGLAAVGGAVAGGVSAATNGTALGSALDKLGEYGKLAVTSAAGNAVTQGVAVATGLQDKFSWRSVAASAIAAPAAQAIVGSLNLPTGSALQSADLATRTSAAFVRGVVGQGVRMLVTHQGKMDYASIAADAFGNAIGESIASQSQPSPYALSGRLGENGGQSAVRFSDPGLTLQDTT